MSHKFQNYHKPFFLITIDTEGDNSWSKPRTITCRNVDFLPRFQALCESYGLKPTYLTNYEVAQSPAFQEFGKNILQCKTGEIGMHLHAWNSPPLTCLTPDDCFFHPYLIEYPEDIMRKKIAVMTDLLEDIFQVKMVSHRAGRWSFNALYAQILVEHGYCVDCSVTPHISWKSVLGDPKQAGGTDYSQFPEEAYLLDLQDVSRAGESSLLEIPVTILCQQRPFANLFRPAFKRSALVSHALDRFLPPRVYWCRPNGKHLSDLLYTIEQAIYEKRTYVEFALHSSELMPGGSPNFRTDSDIEVLYQHLEMLFNIAHEKCVAATLHEYYQWFVNGKGKSHNDQCG